MNDSSSEDWTLNPDKILDTVNVLSRRIQERFPSSGLSAVCTKLCAIAHSAKAQAEAINRAIISIRIATTALIALIVLGVAGTVMSFHFPKGRPDLLSFVQVLEAGINDVVLIGIAVFFLFTAERRIKRHRALRAMHVLRSMAHVIDMHQLTKDPGRLIAGMDRTSSSPSDVLSAPQLVRYLDYCSELLSLVGKIAAIYVQRFDDPVVLAAANEIESLTTGLSRKIWQKIMVAQRL